MSHVPVLLQEVLKALDPKPGSRFIDATANGGGHTNALREAGADVLAIEWDPELAKRLGAVNDSYVNIVTIAKAHGFDQCDGVLFDLGFSSWQIEESGRGFSFERDEPLDMRYDTGQQYNAADIVNTYSEEDIARILKEYGEERFDGRIASAIVRARPIATTFQLVEVIKRAVPFGYRQGRIHCATRTFQALRIAVNHELENIEFGLIGALEVIRPSGRIAAISFHSLEDRIVKNFFRNQSKAGTMKILTKKPIVAAYEEILANKRARSAKIRVAEKL